MAGDNVLIKARMRMIEIEAKAKALASEVGTSVGNTVDTAQESLGNFLGESAGALSRAAVERNIDVVGNTPNFVLAAGSRLPPFNKMFDPIPFDTDILPRITGNDVFAGADLGGKIAGAVSSGDLSGLGEGNLFEQDLFGQAQSRQRGISNLNRVESPTATSTGDLIGDAASIFQGGQGVRKGLNEVKGLFKTDKLVDAAQNTKNVINNLGVVQRNKGFLLTLKDLGSSQRVSSLQRGAGRAAEATAEGIVLGVINNNDPLETGALAGTSQATGSLILNMADPIIGKGSIGAKGIRLTAAAAGLAGVIQMVKEFVPGGKDRILESTESGFAKVMMGVLAGVLTTAAGFNRSSPTLTERMPQFANAIAGIPRNTFIGALRELFLEEEKGNAVPMQVINAMSQKPELFGSETLASLRDSIYNTVFTIDASIAGKINTAMENEEFAAAVNSVNQPIDQFDENVQGGIQNKLNDVGSLFTNRVSNGN